MPTDALPDPTLTEQAKQIALAASILEGHGYTVVAPGESKNPERSPNPAAEPRFAVLIRHRGIIDHFARREPVPGWDAERLESWIHWKDSPEGEVFATLDEAEGHCRFLAEKFGAERYRFSVTESRPVPQWFLVEPKNDREKMYAVGGVEQL